MTRYRHSALENWKVCRRQYTLKYDRGLVSISEGRRMPGKGKRDEGSAAHAGVQRWNETGDLGAAFDAVASYVEITRSFRAGPDGPPLLRDDPEWAKVLKLGQTMLEGYIEWAAATGIDAGREVLGVEQDWEVELPGTEHTLYGTIDLLSRDPLHGMLVVEDFKTVDQLPLLHPANFQGRTYCWAVWRSTGHVPFGFRHRYLRRVLRTGNAKPPFYDTSEWLPINEDVLLAHERQLRWIVGELERSREAADAEGVDPLYHESRYPHPHPRDCNWRCEFRGQCATIEAGNDVEHVFDQHFMRSADLDKEEAPHDEP